MESDRYLFHVTFFILTVGFYFILRLVAVYIGAASKASRLFSSTRSFGNSANITCTRGENKYRTIKIVPNSLAHICYIGHMNQSSIRWGIIGCGDVTEVKSGPAFSKIPDSKLVAVMRRDSDKAKDYARRHGVSKWYSQASDLINDPDVDAVYVATPPLQHEDYTIEVLRAGKPVYVEKPMAINVAAAERMMTAAAETNGKLSVAHYRRQQPLFLKIKSLLEEGAIGQPRLVNLHCFQPHKHAMITQTADAWRYNPAVSGGGLFFDLAPHQLDLMLYFFGPPQTACGLSVNISQLYNADDTTCGQVHFHNGVLFNGFWCFTVPEKRDHCEIIGTKGKLQFSVFENRPVVLTTNTSEVQLTFEPLPHVQQPMIEAVTNYFLNRGENPCSAAEGVTVMKIMETFTQRSTFIF